MGCRTRSGFELHAELDGAETQRRPDGDGDPRARRDPRARHPRAVVRRLVAHEQLPAVEPQRGVDAADAWLAEEDGALSRIPPDAHFRASADGELTRRAAEARAAGRPEGSRRSRQRGWAGRRAQRGETP